MFQTFVVMFCQWWHVHPELDIGMWMDSCSSASGGFLHPAIAQIACIHVHYFIRNRSISIYRHIDDKWTSLKTARNTWRLAALTQRWFYVVVRLSGFRKVLRKSLTISFYLYISLFCVCLAVLIPDFYW